MLMIRASAVLQTVFLHTPVSNEISRRLQLLMGVSSSLHTLLLIRQTLAVPWGIALPRFCFQVHQALCFIPHSVGYVELFLMCRYSSCIYSASKLVQVVQQ